MGVLMRIFDSNSKGMMNVYIYLCVVHVLIWELYLTELYFKDTHACLSDCNWTRTHNHLVHKRTLN